MHLDITHGAVLVRLQVANDAGFADCGERLSVSRRTDEGAEPLCQPGKAPRTPAPARGRDPCSPALVQPCLRGMGPTPQLHAVATPDAGWVWALREGLGAAQPPFPGLGAPLAAAWPPSRGARTLTGVQTLHDGGGVYEVAAAQGAHQVGVELGDLYPGGPVHFGAAPWQILPAGKHPGPPLTATSCKDGTCRTHFTL